MQVLAVASEAYPLEKTGGLADVVGALPASLAREDVHVTTLLPGTPGVLAALPDAVEAAPFAGAAGSGRVLAGRAAGMDVLALDMPALFDRPGHPYLGPDGRDWPDNAVRFAAIAQAGAQVAAAGLVPDLSPDLVHCHDWQAGLVPAYLSLASAAPPVVFTVHNMAFGGLFPADILGRIGLPTRLFDIDGLEFHGRVSFLKAGLRLADHVTTVSPTYAEEIRTEAGGMGFGGLLRSRGAEVSGILNGIDTQVWDPGHDALIAREYDADDLKRRARNTEALARELGLDEDGILFGAITRLTHQKGIDLLIESLPTLLEVGGRLALLGSGDADLEAALRSAAARHPGRIGVRIGYDERLAHLIQAGCDALIVPSRFEPCGLTQLCALRYGAIPVVARVGGLADTVIDANPAALTARVATGVQFWPVTSEALARALRHAAALHADRGTWKRMQRNAMEADVSWATPAAAYAALFRRLTHR